MLVIMKHRNVHQPAQLRLDDKTIRRLDVFKINPAKRRAEIAHTVYELFRIFGRDLKVNRIHIGKTLEQNRLAFHHRLGGQRTKIAKPENGRTIRDHRNHIALIRILIRRRRVRRDRIHRHRDTGGIGKAEVPLRRHWLGRRYFKFPRLVTRVKLQRFLFCELIFFGS